MNRDGVVKSKLGAIPPSVESDDGKQTNPFVGFSGLTAKKESPGTVKNASNPFAGFTGLTDAFPGPPNNPFAGFTGLTGIGKTVDASLTSSKLNEGQVALVRLNNPQTIPAADSKGPKMTGDDITSRPDKYETKNGPSEETNRHTETSTENIETARSPAVDLPSEKESKQQSGEKSIKEPRGPFLDGNNEGLSLDNDFRPRNEVDTADDSDGASEETLGMFGCSGARDYPRFRF